MENWEWKVNPGLSNDWVLIRVPEASNKITLWEIQRLNVLDLINPLTSTWNHILVRHCFTFKDAQHILAMELLSQDRADFSILG